MPESGNSKWSNDQRRLIIMAKPTKGGTKDMRLKGNRKRKGSAKGKKGKKGKK